MSAKIKKTIRISVSALLVTAFLFLLIFQMMLYTSGNERYFSGDAELYYQDLMDAGFPSDYAVSLTELHLLHPNWNFVPLDVTAQNAKYTWNYVIDQESKTDGTNLVSKSSVYQAYWHETERNEPETGYYPPSRAAVEYFMDPRNFLNETDIFQFFDLSASAQDSLDAVKAVLSGTFMENAVLENGMTYATYFCQLGETLGVSPVYLAVKVRQEQGVAGTSPMISGTCGTLLNQYYKNQTQKSDTGKDILPPSGGYTEEQLLAWNGLYNYFNIKANGTGLFEIYGNAMTRAAQGTSAMEEEWGGNAAWNTRWKSLYGGAYFLKTSYIDRYQSTIYLQKFNVDSRSGRTFWGQYMASLYGAMNESRILYQAFASVGVLDSACTFLIPVYGGMPQTLCKDPAESACQRTAAAPTTYQVQNELTSPIRQSAANAAIYTDCQAITGSTLSLKGVFTHSYGLEALEYRWDNEEWKSLSDGKNANSSIPVHFSSNTSHILTVRGKASYNHNDSARKNSMYFLCAVLYVQVVPVPTAQISLQVADVQTRQNVTIGDTFTLPSSNAPDFAGWLGSDGSFLPSGATLTVENDVSFSALFLEFETLEGAAIYLNEETPHLRFSAIMRESAYHALMQHNPTALSVHATVSDANGNTETKRLEATEEAKQNKLCFHAVTANLSPNAYQTPFSAVFSAKLNYTNGETRTLYATASTGTRTAEEVASMALADKQAGYTDAERGILNAIIQKS